MKRLDAVRGNAAAPQPGLLRLAMDLSVNARRQLVFPDLEELRLERKSVRPVLKVTYCIMIL